MATLRTQAHPGVHFDLLGSLPLSDSQTKLVVALR